jgi:hypothetical protein
MLAAEGPFLEQEADAQDGAGKDAGACQQPDTAFDGGRGRRRPGQGHLTSLGVAGCRVVGGNADRTAGISAAAACG